MLAIPTILTALLLVLLFQENYVNAEPLRNTQNQNNKDELVYSDSNLTENDLSTCEEQLSKYRRFLLHAIVSFEDVCDAYNTRPAMLKANAADSIYRNMPPQLRAQDLQLGQVFRNYQPPTRRADIWAFFKLLMAQFDDADYANVIRDAVIERCRIKSQLQHDMKRNSMVLGKKQRFHSWGGKRAPALDSGSGGNALEGYFL